MNSLYLYLFLYPYPFQLSSIDFYLNLIRLSAYPTPGPGAPYPMLS